MVAEIEIQNNVNNKELKLNGDEQRVTVNNGAVITNGNKLIIGEDKNTKESNTDSLKVPYVDFNDLLPLAGDFGLYQFILFLATMPFYTFGVFVYFSQLFITEVSSQHWCWIPELANLTANERRNLAIPPDENSRYQYSRCRSYAANWSQVLISGATPDPIWKTVPCQNGWEFNSSEIPYATISSDLGWVCDKSSYQASAQSIFFFGSVIGGLTIGWLADKYGRLPAVIISNLLGCIGGSVSIFAQTFMEFAVCRFLMGMSYDSCMMLMFLLVLEYMAPRYRTIFSNLSWSLFFSSAAVALPWIALACGHWKTFSLAISLPLSLAALSPFILMESPKWLLSQGRVDDAVKKLLYISRVNKKQIPPKLIQDFKKSMVTQKEEQPVSLLLLLTNPVLCKVFISICILFTCCAVVFDVLVRSLGELGFDFFVSFSVVSFTEFPSILIVAFFMDWMGRRWMMTVTSTLACVFSVATAFISGGLPSVLCAMIARFCINMSFNTAFQWEAELLPTSVRASGIAVIHICASVGTVISPYIVFLKSYVAWLPLVLTGCIAGVGALLALTLPETARKNMPQTFEDAEKLALSQRLFEIPYFSNKKNKKACGTDNFSFEP